MKDYYFILRVDPNISSAEVGKKRKKLLENFIAGDNSALTPEFLTNQYEAYYVLKNPRRKAIYDILHRVEIQKVEPKNRSKYESKFKERTKILDYHAREARKFAEVLLHEDPGITKQRIRKNKGADWSIFRFLLEISDFVFHLFLANG